MTVGIIPVSQDINFYIGIIKVYQIQNVVWKIKHCLIYIFIFLFIVILNLYLIKAFSHNICIIYLLLITSFNLYNIITSILYSFSILLIRIDFTYKHNNAEFFIMVIQMWVPVERKYLRIKIPWLESSSNNDARVLIIKEGRWCQPGCKQY